MATATVTTLNSKLPTVSKIAFCTAAGKGMSTKLYTGQNGKFTRKVGFKQSGYIYPYQIQYRQRSRYTAANAKIKGATWTNWSAWKNAIAVGNIPVDATEGTKPVNRWMRANKGVNKNSSYLTFYNFNAYMIPAAYDARQFEFRVRTVSKSKAKHGTFKSQVLSVYKRAAVVDERRITASDGGLKIKFNYIWDRKCSLEVNSIVDEDGRQLLKKAYTTGVERAKLNANTHPVPRTGYKGGMVNIDISKLKRKITVGQNLTLDVKFVTGDGASTSITSGVVIEPRRDIQVTVTHSWNQALGLLKIYAVNNDSVALSDIGCNVSYTYNSKRYSIAAFNQTKNLTGTSTFYFYPPIGIPLDVQIKEEDTNDYKDEQNIQGLIVTGYGYRLNKLNTTSISGVVWGEASYDISSQPQYQTSLPYGRKSNVVFYGEGATNTINLSATIVDKENCYGGVYGMKAAWDKIMNNQGVYYFRTSKGDMYKVGIVGIDIRHDTKDMYYLSVDMVEVV